MSKLGIILTIVLVYLFLFTALSTAHIISLKLRSDNRHVVPLSNFEFSGLGYVSVVISSVTVTSTSSLSEPDLSRIGFFLQSREVGERQPFDFLQNTSICASDFKIKPVLFTFQNLSNDPQSSLSKSRPVTYSGMKTLFFVNCNNESLVTMEGGAELYNIDDDGTRKNYLSAGLRQLPFLNLTFCFIFISFLGVWILVCSRNNDSLNKTHLLMCGLLVMIIVHYLCVAADLFHVNVTGNHDGLDLLFYISKSMKDVLLFTVTMLIGTGWLFWKPFLEGKDKLVLITVILLQVLANLDPILPWEPSVPYKGEYCSYAPIAYLFCCVAIFIPMFSSHTSLEEIYECDLNACRSLGKLSFFMGFAFAYVLTTMLFPCAMLTPWLQFVGMETTTLVYCAVTFYIFRPKDRKKLNEFYSPV